MATENEKLELLSLLSERRVEQLHLEAPELLEAGAELADVGFIRCGGGIPVRDDNGRVITILNAEITAAGREYLEARTSRNAAYWLLSRKSLIAMGLGAILLLIWLCVVVWQHRSGPARPPVERETEEHG